MFFDESWILKYKLDIVDILRFEYSEFDLLKFNSKLDFEHSLKMKQLITKKIFKRLLESCTLIILRMLGIKRGK